MENKTKKKMPKWLIVVLVIVGIAIVGSALGGNDTTDSDDSNNGDKTNETSKPKELTLEDGHTGALDSTGLAYYIEGYVKNETGKEYSYVSITFTSYDEEGNTLGTCIDNNSGLEKDGRWKFKAMCLSDSKNIVSYKFKEFTNY